MILQNNKVLQYKQKFGSNSEENENEDEILHWMPSHTDEPISINGEIISIESDFETKEYNLILTKGDNDQHNLYLLHSSKAIELARPDGLEIAGK